MMYFIPAWYQENKWCENEQFWYRRRTKTEFDDTVKHIQLFHRNGEIPYKILLLSYAPNLRHFLHRQGVFRANYWSCFDAMCGITRRRTAVLSYRNLKWPDGVEFYNTPFVMVAMLNGEKYAQVEFGEAGNPIQVDMYFNDKICRKNIYDDRGFLSSTVLFDENEQVIHRDYLDENGYWHLREYADGSVLVNTSCPEYLIEDGTGNFVSYNYSKQEYASISEVIEEVFDSYVYQTLETDIFCVAMDPLHYQIMTRALVGRNTIVSFFRSRFYIDKHRDCVELLSNSRYIITDSLRNTDKIVTELGEELGDKLDNIIELTPFDSRVDFGISQQLKVQNILLPVEGIPEKNFEELIVLLAKHMQTNKYARVHLFTRQPKYNIGQDIFEVVRTILERNDINPEWAEPENKKDTVGLLDEEKREPQKFFVDQCIDELEVSKCIRMQRVLVDARRIPDQFLQISCISAGIPQIVMNETQYVVDGGNGRIVEDIPEIADALSFYLENMANWNDAFVYSYELGKEYTTERLMEQWKEVISQIGQD